MVVWMVKMAERRGPGETLRPPAQPCETSQWAIKGSKNERKHREMQWFQIRVVRKAVQIEMRLGQAARTLTSPQTGWEWIQVS